MKNFIHIFYLIFFPFSLILAENYQWGPFVDSVVHLIMSQEYDSAYRLCDSRIYQDSTDIDARYLKLVTMQSQLADYESYILDGPRCISMAESLLIYIDRKSTVSQPDAGKQKLDFLKGSVFGVIGIVKAKRGNILSSITEARMANEYFKKVKNFSSVFPDVLYGLGLFEYYIGDNLKWIPGLGKKAHSGLKKLFIASGSHSPFRFGAKNSLIWILIGRGEFHAADSIASEVLQIYPRNTMFLQAKSRAVYGMHQYQHAIDLGEELIKLSLNRSMVNWSDLLSGYQLISSCWIKLGNKKKAQEIADKGLSCKIPADTLRIEWVQKHRKYLMSIR